MHTCPACQSLNPPDVATCMRCGKELAAAAATAAPPVYAPTPTAVASSHESAAAQIGVGSALSAGRYELDRELGSGAMGSVFEATDTRLDRKVALKVLSGELLSHATARERMGREARGLARIEHPNVVQIRDVFDEGPFLVLVLELVLGGDLAERVSSGDVSPEEAVRLMDGVLAGLHAIHGAGLVHRDVKPSNVLLGDGGVPKVTDLGVAHDSRGRAMTGIGAQLGTAEYMSPEQIRGTGVDARTDVYSAGVMLFEMVVGGVPFSASSDFDICHAHVHEPPNLTRLSDGVNPHLAEVVRRALAKDPAARWQTAEEMRVALHDTALEFSSADVGTTPGAPTPGRAAAVTESPTGPRQIVVHQWNPGAAVIENSDVMVDTNIRRGWISGRGRRMEYFLGSLLNTVLFMVMGGLFASGGGGAVAGLLLLVIILTYAVGLGIRRCHDLGHSGWLVLLSFLPYVNFVFGLYLVFASGEPGPNRFGPPPGAIAGAVT